MDDVHTLSKRKRGVFKGAYRNGWISELWDTAEDLKALYSDMGFVLRARLLGWRCS